jgi:drug/metabolite transporter (DMT)-like permease
MLMSIILILWGSFAAVSKVVLNQIDSFQLQFYMFFIAFIIMSFLFLANGKIEAFKKLSKKECIKLSLYALPSYTYYFMYTMSLKLIPAVEASMLNYMFPVMIVLFAVPIHGEKLTLVKFSAIFLGIAGMIVVVSGGNLTSIRMTNLSGDLLAIGAAVSWGLFSNLGKKNNIDSFISNYCFVLVSLILSTVSIVIFSNILIPKPSVWLGLTWISVSNIVLTYYLWFKVLKTCSSTLIASLSFITPFITLLFIMLFLGEKISYVYLLGFLIIITGIAIQSTEPFFSHKRELKHKHRSSSNSLD